MKTIVALYNSMNQARTTVTELESAGIPHSNISLVANDRDDTARTTTGHDSHKTGDTHADDGAGTGATLGTLVGGGAGLLAGLGALAIPGIGPIVAAGPLVAAITGAGVGAASGGLLGALVGSGIPEKDAHVYSEGVRRGGALLTVKADEARVTEIEAIMGRHDPIDIDERESTYRTEGWTRFDHDAGDYDHSRAAHATTGSGLTGAAAALRSTDGTADRTSLGTGREEHIPIVEEQVNVGKRAVERNRVRIHTHVEEVPVEQTVSLRDETVHVERRDATGVTGDIPADAFQERVVEVSETDEEAVIAKRAQVTGEVVVSKDAVERSETIHETVRKTEVDVDGDVARDTTRGTTRRDI